MQKRRDPRPAEKDGYEDGRAHRQRDGEAGREQRVDAVVFAARVELGDVLDVDVRDAQRRDADITDEDEDHAPDAVGIEANARQHKGRNQDARDHVAHAREHGRRDVAPHGAVNGCSFGLHGRCDGGRRQHLVLLQHFHRLGDRFGGLLRMLAHGCTSRLVRTHAALREVQP